MAYFFLAILALIPIATVAGFIYAYKKLSRRNFALLTVAVIAGPYLVFKLSERQFMLEAVPDALEVSSILYSSEDSSGFGPGAHASGIRLYPLSEKISLIVKERGMDFFETLSENKGQKNQSSRDEYWNWKKTPVGSGQDGFSDKTSGSLDVEDFICNYGFCISIEPMIHEQANAIINSPGSFYAEGRSKMIFVSPEKNLVLFIYNH